MRCCWSHDDGSTNMIAPSVLLLGMLCISSIFREASTTDFSALQFQKIFAVFAVLFVLPMFFAYVSARKYHVSIDGLTIFYPFGIKHHFAWNEFCEIALCKIHYASGSSKHILGIRCAVTSEQSVPKNAILAREWWSSMGYEFIHFRKLITIYYTDERFVEIKKFCPVTIKDYRHLKDLA